MTIIIPISELEEKFQLPVRTSYVKGLSIDYATNSIHGWFENEEHIIFKFRDYGMINDNRYNSYSISSGEAGILINIIKK